MSTQLSKKSVARNYAFLAVMLGAMILGSIVGWIFPQELDAEGNVISTGATVLEPLGTLFLNMMFCIVVPMVFSSIAGSVATMKSRKRAGKIMGTTVLTFVITGAIAAVIMIVIMKIFPPVLEPWTNLTEGVVEDPISIPDLIVNFFTVSDFSGLLSRSAISGVMLLRPFTIIESALRETPIRLANSLIVIGSSSRYSPFSTSPG